MEINLMEQIKSLNQSVVKKLFSIRKATCNPIRPRPLQIAILEYLIEHSDEEIYQKDLESSFKISKAAISDTLNAMEKNNLIKRNVSKIDARRNIIIPTKESLDMHKDLIKDIKQVNEELLNCPTKEEVNEFLRITEKLKNYMKEGK